MKKRTLTVIMAAAAMSAIMAFSALAGEWIKDSNGWWFQNSDGTYPAGGLYNINGVNYAFNEYGYMVANSWYQSPTSGKWFYALGSGELAKDQWIDGQYYIGSDGAMMTDGWTPDGYYVDASGKWDPNATGQGTNNPEDIDDSLGAYSLTWTAKNAQIDDSFDDSSYGQSIDTSGYGDSAGITNWYTWDSNDNSSSGSSDTGSSSSADSGSSSVWDNKPVTAMDYKLNNDYEDITVTEVLGN